MAAPYWMEFGQVALAHLLAVASPGPDFAIVVRQSLTRGRAAARWTAIGIGCGILLHITYSLLGVALLLRGSPGWFDAVKWLGAAYLAWLGVQGLRAPPRDPAAPAAADARANARGSFLAGFATNALGNPKATLFFLALFTVVIDPATPRWAQAAYGLWMAAATAAWFCLVAAVFAQESVRRRFLARGHWIERALGGLFLAFALSLVVSDLG